MQKRVRGLPFYQFSEVGKLIKPGGTKDVREQGLATGHVNLYFIQKQCRPSRASILPHGRKRLILIAKNKIRAMQATQPMQNIARSNSVSGFGTSFTTSYGTGTESTFAM